MKQTTPTQTDKLFLFVIQHDFEENEILKEIPDTNGKYFISNSGYVLSLCRNKPLILKPYDCGNGYSFVKINGKNKRIHRLVGNAFIINTIILFVVVFMVNYGFVVCIINKGISH